MFRVTKIELDSNGHLPTRIMLLQSGNWPNSIKGDFAITADDLKQVKDNFDNGIGFPSEDASTGLAIDFKHEYDDQAAAWIKGLELDTSDPKVTKLYASPVEWTDAGAAAVQGGQFKMISPSGYFGRKSGRLSAWPNPQNMKEKIANVLDGAGLTNIPFLRGMSPIRASAQDEKLDNEIEYDKVIFISTNDKHKSKEQSMTLDSIRVKDLTALTAEEKAFLLEPAQATQLSAEELEKFGIKQTFAIDGEGGEEDADKNKGADDKNKLSTEDQALLTDENRKLLADVKAGNVKVLKKEELTADQQRLSSLEESVGKYEKKDAEAIVLSHVKRGAIKQDASEFWTKQLLDASGQARTDLEAQLTGLPSNEQLLKEIGTGEDANAGSTAREQFDSIAKKKVADAAKEGKDLLYADALKLAIKENPDMNKQDKTEQTKGVK